MEGVDGCGCRVEDGWMSRRDSDTAVRHSLAATGAHTKRSSHLIFYSLKTAVKRNCVYKVHTHTDTIKCYGDKGIDM